METVITGRQMTIVPALKRHIEERTERIAKYGFKSPQVMVTLKEQKYRKTAEVHINLSGVVLQAEEETSDLQASFDKAMTKVERQLKKHKETVSSHRPQSLNGRKPATIAETKRKGVKPAAAAAKKLQEEPPLVVEPVAIEALTQGEALAQMKSNRVSVFLFRNRSNRKVQLLHKKRNGTISLLEPVDL
jgi:putative sigma-54 modulation protein